QGRREVGPGLGLDADGCATADTDDPPVPPGQVLLPRPDLTVEIVEVGATTERCRCLRWLLALHRAVRGLAPGVALLVGYGVGPRHEVERRGGIPPLLGQ